MNYVVTTNKFRTSVNDKIQEEEAITKKKLTRYVNFYILKLLDFSLLF